MDNKKIIITVLLLFTSVLFFVLLVYVVRLRKIRNEKQILDSNSDTIANYIIQNIGISMNTQQSESIKSIVRAFKQYGDGDFRKLSYILGTAQHESGFMPIREKEDTQRGDVWNSWQSAYWGTGYYGRGFVQLTWKANYQKFSDLLGIDLVGQPDLALEKDTAADIIVIGMMKGMFTGKKLGDYITPVKTDWYNSRRIINGMVKAQAQSCLEKTQTIYPLLLAFV